MFDYFCSGCGPAWLGRVRKHCPDVEKAGGLRLPVLQPNVGLAKEINSYRVPCFYQPRSFTGASKFAPHLEKCLGMGRSSSRLAHKRAQVAVESEGENSEDEEEWTFPEKKGQSLVLQHQHVFMSSSDFSQADEGKRQIISED